MEEQERANTCRASAPKMTQHRQSGAATLAWTGPWANTDEGCKSKSHAGEAAAYNLDAHGHPCSPLASKAKPQRTQDSAPRPPAERLHAPEAGRRHLHQHRHHHGLDVEAVSKRRHRLRPIACQVRSTRASRVTAGHKMSELQTPAQSNGLHAESMPHARVPHQMAKSPRLRIRQRSQGRAGRRCTP